MSKAFASNNKGLHSDRTYIRIAPYPLFHLLNAEVSVIVLVNSFKQIFFVYVYEFNIQSQPHIGWYTGCK